MGSESLIRRGVWSLGIGSKPCHLNGPCKYKFRQLEPKCCSEPFFSYTPFQPTKFCLLIRPPLVVSISFISVDPSILRQVAYPTRKKEYIYFLYLHCNPASMAPHTATETKKGPPKGEYFFFLDPARCL
jgi:hypothetical protein